MKKKRCKQKQKNIGYLLINLKKKKAVCKAIMKEIKHYGMRNLSFQKNKRTVLRKNQPKLFKSLNRVCIY